MDPETPQNPIITQKEHLSGPLHFIRSPKFSIILILLLIALVVIFALKLISIKPAQLKNSQIQEIPPALTQVETTNPRNQEINSKIESYNKKVDTLNNSLKISDPPQVQLDVTF